MCITRDGENCVLLTPKEQRAEHDFEDRKGRYPKELADRLHTQGIMTRETHLRESLMRRRENIERFASRRPQDFYPGMDCTPDENDFIDGRRHDLSPEFFFPMEFWPSMLAGFTDLRRRRFCAHVINWHGNAGQALYLLAYPEFDRWFDVFVLDAKERGRKKRALIDCVLMAPELLAKVTHTASAHTLSIIAERMFFNLSGNGATLWDSGVLAKIIGSVPSQHRHHFETLSGLRNALHALPQERSSRRPAHRKRQALKKQVRICAHLLQGNPSMVRDAVKHVVEHLIVTQANSTALAA